MKILSLDKIAQEKAVQILDAPDKETLERLVTKALGVLQAQGVYAMMLFLFSRTSDKEKEVAEYIREPLYRALQKLPKFKDDEKLQTFDKKTPSKEVLEWFSQNITTDLDDLFLVRELYEQTLIYARFHAKAEKEAKST